MEPTTVLARSETPSSAQRSLPVVVGLLAFILLVFMITFAKDMNEPSLALPSDTHDPTGLIKQSEGEASTTGVPRGKVVERLHNATGLKYELFVPTVAPPAGEKYAMLVFLHGAGESDNFGVMNAQSLPSLLMNNKTFVETFPMIVLMPQCPILCLAANHWLPEVFTSIDEVLESVRTELNGDVHRTVLTGQSMGGHGAWLYASARPQKWSAVVPVCSYTQEQKAVTAQKVCDLEHQSCPPVWLFHAANDVVIPVSESDDMNSALKALGADVKYTRYDWAPGPPMPEYASLEGHGSYEYAYRDASLYKWMLAQRCANCAAQPAAGAPLAATHVS